MFTDREWLTFGYTTEGKALHARLKDLLQQHVLPSGMNIYEACLDKNVEFVDGIFVSNVVIPVRRLAKAVARATASAPAPAHAPASVPSPQEQVQKLLEQERQSMRQQFEQQSAQQTAAFTAMMQAMMAERVQDQVRGRRQEARPDSRPGRARSAASFSMPELNPVITGARQAWADKD